MISAISILSILCVTAIVLTLVLILKLILSSHGEDGMVEIDIRERGKEDHYKVTRVI